MQTTAIRRHNLQYEQYLDREIRGTDLATLINKAVDANRRNEVEQDAEGYFIDNGTNSIKIDIEMITIEETFSMEQIYQRGMPEFVQAFNFTTFESINVEYHAGTGKISRIVFLQLEE